MKANLLLSQKGIDTGKLSRSLHTIDLKASYEPLEPLGETDVEGLVLIRIDFLLFTFLFHIPTKASNTVSCFLTPYHPSSLS
jgi:hypothetical protein